MDYFPSGLAELGASGVGHWDARDGALGQTGTEAPGGRADRWTGGRVGIGRHRVRLGVGTVPAQGATDQAGSSTEGITGKKIPPDHRPNQLAPS